MKIGLIINTVEPVFEFNAGGHLRVLHVARLWARQHELTFFGPPLARERILEEIPDARYVVMPSLDMWLSQNRLLSFLARLTLAPLALPQLRTCDVVLATSHFLPDTIPAALCGRKRSAAIVWHIIESALKREGSTAINCVSWLSESASLLLVKHAIGGVIGGTRHVLTQLGLPNRGQIDGVTTNGIEHLSDGASDAVPKVWDGLYIGRLHPTKGIEDALQAWVHVRETHPAARLAVIGHGEAAYRESLEERARTLGIADAVTFFGKVDKDLKTRMLGESKLFIFPSKEEGWGIVLGEAMHAGVPTVTYELPHYPEIFPGGRMSVPIGDVAAFGKTVTRLLSDAGLRETLGSEGRVIARDFTWENAAGREMKVLAALPR